MANSLFLLLAVLACIPFNKWLTKKRLPDSAINILVGVIVGPLFLNWVSFDETAAIAADVAVVALLFASGLGVHWLAFRQNLAKGSLLGIVGIVASLILGFIASYAVDNRFDEAMYVAVALSATSIGISIESFRQYKLQNTPLGNVLLAAAVIDDVVALYLMSSLHSLSSSNTGFISLGYSMLVSLGALLVLGTALFFIARSINRYTLLDRLPLRVTCYLLIGGVSALITSIVGLSGALGAFIAGLMLTIVSHGRNSHRKTHIQFERLFNWMVPVFFISIGIRVAQIPVSGKHLLMLTGALLLAAILGKLFSPWCIKNHFSNRERWTLGFALLPRGEVGLIVASMGLQQGHVSEHTMIALVTMTLATAIIAPVGIAIASYPLQQR